VFARDNFSILKDISIFTYEDNIALEEVLIKLYEIEGGKTTIDTVSASVDELKAKMEEVVPTYDKANVYTSDMKKLFKWYNMLVEKKLWSPEDAEAGDDKDATDKAVKTAPKKTPKPKAKSGGAGKAATKQPKANIAKKGQQKK